MSSESLACAQLRNSLLVALGLKGCKVHRAVKLKSSSVVICFARFQTALMTGLHGGLCEPCATKFPGSASCGDELLALLAQRFLRVAVSAQLAQQRKQLPLVAWKPQELRATKKLACDALDATQTWCTQLRATKERYTMGKIFVWANRQHV